MKFRPDSDEMVCGKRVPGELSDKYDDLGGIACLRTAGHPGECVAMARDAGIADGVYFCCRLPLDGPHRDTCHTGKPCTHTEDCPNCERLLSCDICGKFGCVGQCIG